MRFSKQSREAVVNQTQERVHELQERGLITPEQEEELLAALAALPEEDTGDVESAAPGAVERPAPSAPGAQPLAATTGVHQVSVRLVSGGLVVHGVQGLAGVRVVRGGSSVRTSQQGDSVHIEAAVHMGEIRGFGFSIGFGDDEETVELDVPADAACELKTASGDITLDGLAGDTVVRSISGDVSIQRAAHLSSVQSTSGDIDVDGSAILGDVLTKSGDIQLRSCSVKGMVKSYSGDVLVQDSTVDDVDVLSFSGDVRMEGVTLAGSTRLKTTSGDVEADLRQHDVMVDVDTRAGEAHVTGPGVDTVVQHQRIPVGQATVELAIHTGSGDIAVALS